MTIITGGVGISAGLQTLKTGLYNNQKQQFRIFTTLLQVVKITVAQQDQRA